MLLPLKSYALNDYLALIKAFFDQSQDNVAVYDETGKPVYFNGAFEKTISKTIDTIHQAEHAWQQTFKPYIAAYHAVLVSGLPSQLRLQTHHHQANQVIDDLIHISPIFSADQTLLGVMSIGRNVDVIDRQSNQEIRVREQYQRALLDNFPFMVWLKDKDSRFLACNEVFARVAGATSAQEMIGKTDEDYFPEHCKGYIEDDLEVLTTGVHKTVVQPIRHSHGEVNWAETYKSPVKINGEVIGTVGFARDVSDLKKLEADFMRSKSEYIALMESLPLTIVRYNLVCRRIFVNKNYERSFNLAPQQVLGTTPSELWHSSITSITGHEFQQRMQSVLATGEQQVFEINVEKQGKPKVYLMRIIPEYSHHRMIGLLSLSSDISEISRYRERIEFMAYHDMLTRLPNRTLFNDRVASTASQASHASQKFGILMIDLDHFKAINDTYGHLAGDYVLTETAETLRSTIRSEDFICRWGGEEFVIVVRDCDEQHLMLLAEKIREAIEATDYPFKGKSIAVTTSLGVAKRIGGEDIDHMIYRADNALYRAKHAGRNQVVLAS